MYNVIKSVIMSQRFELTDMLRKIDTLWLESQLTDDQKAELEKLAREHADPEMSRNLAAMVEDHEARLCALEKGSSKPTPEPDPDEPAATDEYPAWQKDHPYHTGDKVTHKGKRYICHLPEYVDACYWSPSAYPDYWKLAE